MVTVSVKRSGGYAGGGGGIAVLRNGGSRGTRGRRGRDGSCLSLSRLLSLSLGSKIDADVRVDAQPAKCWRRCREMPRWWGRALVCSSLFCTSIGLFAEGTANDICPRVLERFIAVPSHLSTARDLVGHSLCILTHTRTRLLRQSPSPLLSHLPPLPLFRSPPYAIPLSSTLPLSHHACRLPTDLSTPSPSFSATSLSH